MAVSSSKSKSAPLGLPLPVVSAWDPSATASGSIDPLGALRPFTALATTLLPGVTTITTRIRYLSWICAGLKLLDEIPDAPRGGRAGRRRRAHLLAWERLVALATGLHALEQGAQEHDAAWRQLRGVTYVRRAAREGALSARYNMLRNPGGAGGVGTYWVTLVAGERVEGVSGALTPRGEQLAEAFLQRRDTPPRGRLTRALMSDAMEFDRDELLRWGASAHLGGAEPFERGHLADALLEPQAHARMASAMRAASSTASEAGSFRRLSSSLADLGDPLSGALAACAAVVVEFEALHLELLFRFDQIRAADVQDWPVNLSALDAAAPDERLLILGESLAASLDKHAAGLPGHVAQAVRAFLLAVEPAFRASTRAGLVRALVGHHQRVQSGKHDASRQPKMPWIELLGDKVIISPRYALAEPPERSGADAFTHPYRIEQFQGMLEEAGVWEVTG